MSETVQAISSPPEPTSQIDMTIQTSDANGRILADTAGHITEPCCCLVNPCTIGICTIQPPSGGTGYDLCNAYSLATNTGGRVLVKQSSTDQSHCAWSGTSFGAGWWFLFISPSYARWVVALIASSFGKESSPWNLPSGRTFLGPAIQCHPEGAYDGIGSDIGQVFTLARGCP